MDLYYFYAPPSDSWNLHFSLLIAGFVLSVESWIWLERYKVKFSLACLEEIALRYSFVPRS